MDTLLLTFANTPADLLPTLQEEDDTLSHLLTPRARARHFFLHRESYTTSAEIARLVLEFRDTLALFHFSGHAGRDRLVLGDGAAHGEGLVQLLGMCPRLRLVFLNGCSTRGMVGALLGAGIPIVLATSAPVDDRRATEFSIRFYEALHHQLPVREAFAVAKASLDLVHGPGVTLFERGTGLSAEAGDEPAWGLYFEEKNEHQLDWRLPADIVVDGDAAGYVPNNHLIETLFQALGEYNPEVKRLYQQAKSGLQIPLPKKRMAVLNALPAPLAEPLRKLMVPVSQENLGFDKVSEARIRQIVQAYGTAVEMLAFIMLAQLWEAYYSNPALRIEPPQRALLAGLFRLNRKERAMYDFLQVIRGIREVFEHNQIEYFVEEIRGLRQLVSDDEQFAESVRYLASLHRQVAQFGLDRGALAYQCKTGEQCLAYLYARLGFMARYRLATIQGIDVVKFRHQRTPSFDHVAVMLHDLLGGFDVSSLHLGHSLDNRSVLLINEETWQYLNLSPFVIDENAFQERTEICKLYFFSHYVKNADTYCYNYVNKPDDPQLEVSEQKYPLIKEQFEAFANLLLLSPMSGI